MNPWKWTSVNTQDVEVDTISMWRAIDIWWSKPHVVNRRLSAAVEEHRMPLCRERGNSGVESDSSPLQSFCGVISPDPEDRVSKDNKAPMAWLAPLIENLKSICVTEGTLTASTVSLAIAEYITKHHHQGQGRDAKIDQQDQKDSQESLSFSAHELQSHAPREGTKDGGMTCEPQESNKTDVDEVGKHKVVAKEHDKPSLPIVSHCSVGIRKLLPKIVGAATIHEIGIFDHSSSEATFILLAPCIRTGLERGESVEDIGFPSYRFTLKSNRIALSVCEDYSLAVSKSGKGHPLTIPSKEWLENILLPKLAKWAGESKTSSQPHPQGTPLIPMDRYTQLYQEMKIKYGAKFVEIWPENTDPKKFVYEDVAIATYLLLLFEGERREMGVDDGKKQSFIDLGCGNGLLVHILNSEGYPGKGIDLRRRKIWDLYGSETCLEEGAVIASMETSFRDTDWLIGNHSDELTPWIPVMASRSSSSTRYFVLPCCFHDFDRKFAQRVAGESQYRSYLNFVREVGEVCGFVVQEDKMRIPSTKRICHVGKRKTHSVNQHQQVLQRITEYVSGCCKSSSAASNRPNTPSGITSAHSTLLDTSATPSKDFGSQKTLKDDDEEEFCNADAAESSVVLTTPTGDGRTIQDDTITDSPGGAQPQNLAPNFRPRDREEKVQNCSRVERSLKERITLEVAWAILEAGGVKRPAEGNDAGLEIGNQEQEDVKRGQKSAKLWRKGGSVTLRDAAQLFDGPSLKKLKSECGGLKTLLKTSNQVFQITGNQVMLRDWSSDSIGEGDRDEPLGGRKRSEGQVRKEEKREGDRLKLFKTKLCWFHAHHPDGCPKPADACPFAHGNEELRSRPVFGK
ncbi:probable tRNA (uracil-O(2)-)-methyltransferase [Diadema antillarum]|uniref:probable tRNA (uracil-O(2)-)-methyltransferase n=1 Tax=Diadema antillarum TaxID=105358 RepID=UPI003A871432